MVAPAPVVRSSVHVATTEDRSQAFAAIVARRAYAYLVYTGGAIVTPPRRIGPLRGATAIGREVADGIALPDDRKASRHHATLHASPTGAVRLVDERSRNGSLVNGLAVTERVLADGDAAIPPLLGYGPGMRAARAAIARVATTAASVLIVAETGSGKELAARAVHERSRPAGPFVAVNCAAIPETLAESQLFGQLAGAFTGAVARPGLIRSADGGTLFLDELGELSPALQPKLLRVLQDRAVLPVGATAPVACDVRIVAATNRDLRAEVDRGAFRADLYARLAELPLRLPPLRDRREDILALLAHALGPGAPRLTPRLAEATLLHGFPFNVREVQALAAQLRLAASPLGLVDTIHAGDLLAPRPAPAAPASAPATPAPDSATPDSAADRDPPPDRAELEALLRTHRGVVANVARAMQRSRKQVYRWIEQHGLDVAAFR